MLILVSSSLLYIYSLAICCFYESLYYLCYCIYVSYNIIINYLSMGVVKNRNWNRTLIVTISVYMFVCELYTYVPNFKRPYFVLYLFICV